MNQVVERDKQIDEEIKKLLNEKSELKKNAREQALKEVRSLCRRFSFTYPMLKEHLKVSPKVMIETREYKQGEYEKLVDKLKAEKRERNRKYKQKQKENEKSDQSKKKIQTSVKSQAKKENEIPIENVISQSSNTETKKKRKKNMMVEASDNFASIESFT